MKLAPGRTNLATVLDTWLPSSVSIVDHLPDSITPPCVILAWSDPWVKPATYCAWQASMEIMVIAQRIEPGGKMETLEDIVQIICPAIKAMPDYQCVDVTAPYPVQIAGVDYLAASINLTYDVED